MSRPELSGQTIHRWVEAQVAQRSNSPAVVFGDAVLTYGALDARANQLAHHLARHGVGPDVVVGVYLERSIDLIVTLLAILKAGGAYLPLDPSYPPERIAFMLDDCAAPVLITNGAALELSAGRTRIDLSTAANAIAGEPTTRIDRDVDGENLAYIIYTSGSTGRPKGVLIPHSRVTRLFTSTEPWFQFNEKDVWSFFHSYAFDFSVWEIWGALVYGGSVVVVPETVRRSPDEFLELLAAKRVTVLNQIPSAFRNLIGAAARRPTTLPLALRYVIFGGEALELTGLVPWFARYPHAPTLVNMYGITETTVHVTYRPVDPAECPTAKGSPIGVPIPDLEIHLLDGALHPVRGGEEGEIYVGGAGLARGYHQRAALTAERFVPDAFSGRPGARLYKTGDLARRLPDGSFDYLGRNDAQVKIRGYRIETGEIAAAIAAHPAVRQAAVAARENAGDKRLVGYVALTSSVSMDELRDFIAEKLPRYMVPSAFVVIDELPITASGKIDFKALPPPDWSAQSSRNDYVAPNTEAEKIMAALWSSLIGVSRIGRDDRFFEIGGHSLLAAQCAARLASDYGVTLPIRLFLSSPTLADAAQILGEALAKRGAQHANLPKIPRRARQDRAAISFAQESIWVHEQIMQDVSRRQRAYIECPALRIRGPLSAPLLERTLNEIAARHEIWRTGFVLEGDPVQVIGQTARIPLRLFDRKDTSTADRRDELETIALSLASRPFDVGRPPLVRCALVSFAADEHVLLMVMHHLITDAWSEDLIASEVARLYGLLAAGEALPPRTEVEVQYADYATWERGQAHDAVREQARAYWREVFATPPEPLALARIASTASRPIRVVRRLGAEPTARIHAFCRDQNVSLSAVLYAAYATVVAPWSRDGRFVLGIATANRAALSERIVGCLSGVLPLFLDTSDRPSFEVLAQRLMTSIADAMPHGALPLPEIGRLARAKSGAPFVQIQAATQTSWEPHTAGPLTLVQDFIPVNEANFALNLIVQEHQDRTVELTWVGDPASFEVTTLQQLASAFERVLEAGLITPARRIDELVATANQRATSIHRLVEAQAKMRGEKPAVRLGDATLSYNTLDERANRLAHRLVRLGVGPDVVVGVYMERSLDLVVALLAVLKAGGAYLPLDPNYPADRVAFMLGDCRAPVLVTNGPCRVPFAGTVVDLAVDASAIAAEPTTSITRAVDPDNLAYVIYTSGSTGKPKGVLIPHNRVTRLFWATEEWFHFGEQDVWTFFHSYAFDFSVWEIWGALIHGGTVVVVPESARRSPDEFLALLASQRVTVLNQIPSAFRHLIATATRTPSTTPLALRYVIFGGEALELRGLLPWFERYPDAPRLINMYGITETTVHVTYRPIDPRECKDAKGSPIGVAIPDLEMHVLDARLGRVPDGEEGELYVGGLGLARGYHDRPDLTAQRFVPDPFSGRPGARLYKTGDLARRLPDGTFDYLGRNDAQVKIRGYRIETGEIVAALCTHPAVREAAVVVREIEEGDRRLVAYIVLRQPVDLDVLRAHVVETLPSFMIPSAFVVLDALPVAPSGKLDLKALPAPTSSGALPDALVAATSDDEKLVATLWQNALRVERVGLQQDFFELGGNSLLAIKVVAKLREAFGVELTLARFFAAPTVDGVVAEIARLRGAADSALTSIPKAPRDSPVPASNAQERIWFVERMTRADDPRPFNIALTLEITGELDVTALTRAFDELVARQESWRTRFQLANRQLVQIVDPPFVLDVPVVEMPALSGEARRSRIVSAARELAVPAFDLAKDRLVRARLVRFSATDHVLLVAVHHIVYDGTSSEVFARELARLYEVARGAPALPALAVQYADFACWQRTSVSPAAIADQVAYWTERLAGAPVVELGDLPRPSGLDYNGALHRVQLPRALTVAARALSQQAGVSLFNTLLAAFSTLLVKRSGQTDLVIGTMGSARDRAELEPLLGLFLNNLALRIDAGGDPTFRELVQRLRNVMAEAFANRDAPFERVVAALKRKPDANRGGLYQISMHVNRVPTAVGPAGQVWRMDLPDMPNAVDDLELEFVDDGHDLVAAFKYRTSLFRPQTISRMADQLVQLLGRALASPDAPLSSLVAPRLTHELIADRADATPDAIAARCAETTVTYRELDERANRVAHALLSRGLRLDDPVAVVCERSIDQIVAMLGIMKAGGAFLPIDPTHPRERVQTILQDGRARFSVGHARWQSLVDGTDAIWLDRDDLSSHPATRPMVGIDDRNLAYVLFTSGSTGRPKGVMIEHRGLSNYLEFCAAAYPQSGPGAPFHSSISFDLTITSVLAPLITGRTIYVVPEGPEGTNVENLTRVLATSGPMSFLKATPSHLDLIARAVPPSRARHVAQCLIVGGEQLLERQLRFWREHAPDTTIVNEYGPTETVVGCSVQWVDTDCTGSGAIPIGKAFAGNRLYVLDDKLAQTSDGELYIGGVQLARGYASHPDLTATRFVPDPHGAPGERLYRTGDHIRQRADGTLEFLGRFDDQVKIRGFRIELGDVETALAACTGIEQCAVVARDDAAAGKQLVAYVVTSTGSPEIATLRAELASKVPEYMVPSAFVSVPTIALSASGKLDRRSLPAPEVAPTPDRATRVATTYVAPRDPTEQALAGIWSELLGVGAVGVHDNFFELGGHSILAAHAAARIQDVFGIDVPLRTLFEAVTIDQLANHVRGHASASPLEHSARAIARFFEEILNRSSVGLDDNFFELGGQILATQKLIERVRDHVGFELALKDLIAAPTPMGIARVLLSREPAPPSATRSAEITDAPLSFTQQRLWFAYQLAPTSAAYNMPLARRVRGPLELEPLRQTLEQLIHRHAVLRTTYPTHDGAPRQSIQPPGRVELAFSDLSALPLAGREQALARAVAAEVDRPFDLATAPPVRARVFRVAPDDHVFVLTVHHIASDGRSLDILWHELAATYRALVKGTIPALRSGPAYSRFAIDQRQRLTEEVLDRYLARWKAELEGAPARADLPYRSTPSSASGRPKEIAIGLDSEVSAALRALAKRNGSSLFMTGLAALRVVLGRVTGQLDLCIGAPFDNRRGGALDDVVGCFVNTLPLRAEVDPGASFVDALQRERATVLDAYERQETPFERILQTLGVERVANQSPLFQVTYQHVVLTDDENDWGRAYEPERSAAQYDLDVETAEKGDVLELRVVYNEDRFEGWAIESFAHQLACFLRGVAHDARSAVGHVPLIESGERQRLVDAWNKTDVAIRPTTAVELFEAHADRHPSQPAVIFGDSQVTYRELDERANAIAAALRERGVGREMIVGIALKRSVDLVAAILGVFKAGAAYVPLDPALPTVRIEYLVATASVKAVVTTSLLAGALPDLPAIEIDVLVPSATRPRVDRDPDDLAYIIFTSGSTGQPKGVMVSQRALANELHASTRTLGELSAADGFLQLAPFTFDQSVHEILWPVTSGGRLVMIADGDQRDPAKLVHRIRTSRVTIVDAVPTLLAAIVGEPGFPGCKDLRLLVCGGEALSRDLVRKVFAAKPGVPLLDGYGPTETAITVCYSRVSEDAIALGTPWANVRFYVLDEHGEPAALGTPGELYIAGTQLARGYIGRPDLSAERFVPDPFQSGRMYRTGDRVRRRPDGTLDFLGRIDSQVKIRGVRIELGEIESALRQHPAVASCVVIAAKTTRGDELVAYVVLRTAADAGVLRTHLAERLPDYMVPASYVVLDALPLTSSGKLDRRALPAPRDAAPAREAAPVPAGDDETLIAAIFSEVLDIESIASDEDFFMLGGHSLLATQVVSRVREAFGVEFTLQHLFDEPTITGVTAEVARLKIEHSGSAQPERALRTSDELPLSYAQQRLWLVQRVTPESGAYNIPDGRRVIGALDLEALRSAIEEVVRRHEILRTSFPAPGGVPQQHIAPAGRWELPVDDLSSLGDAARDRELERISLEDAGRPFDLEHGPVLRTRVVRKAATDHVVLVTMHHIVSDGWSFEVFWREVIAFYEAHRHHRAAPIPALPLQYGDYALQQRQLVSGDALADQLAWWKQQLADAPAEVALPHKAPRSLQARAMVIDVQLADAAVPAMRAAAQSAGATLFMALVAAFRVVLARTCGQTDVVIGTPVAKRDRKELEQLIGLFVNTLVLRAEVDTRSSFQELVKREREVQLAAYAHQDAPFEMIVDELGVERSPTRSPVFQIWFVQEGVRRSLQSLDKDLVEAQVMRGVTTSKFDLSVYVNEIGDGLELSLVYNADLLDTELVQGIARRFVRALELLASDPHRSVDELDFGEPATADDPSAPLEKTPYPPVLAVLEQLVARDGDAPALRYRDRTWTRRELWASAGSIASTLLDAGIAPGDRVALTGASSAGLIAAFLGALRSGATLVALSPRLAPENVDRLVAATGARLIMAVTGAPGGFTAAPTAWVDAERATLVVSRVAERTHVPDPTVRYVYFTSGTTGAQKGVVGNLDPLAHFVAWQTSEFGDATGSVCAQLTDFGFDVFMREVMFALVSGKTLALPPRDVADLAPAEMLRWLAEERISVVHAVPSIARVWLAECPPDVRLPDLRCLFFVGEPLDAALVNRWRERFGANTDVINFYGTTETGPAKCWYRVPHPAPPGLQPIGQTLPQTQLFIMRGDHLCAAGEVGEIVIRTPFSTLGYLDGTRGDAFAVNPFRADPLDILYRTGDVGRRRSDGAVDVVGRADDQVKIRGQRVDPTGIAATLRTHSDVVDAAVIATKVDGDVMLAAYVVRSTSTLSSTQLRDLLRATVPPYMLPAAFMFVDALPRKPNGKLDRAALPPPDWASTDADTYTAPRTPEEEAIVAIWSEVLELPRIGVRDDFFALGGHSLLAVLVTSRVRALFDVDVTIQKFFQSPTVEAMAEEVTRLRGSAQPAAVPPLVPIPRDADLPLSFAQQRMWFLHRLAPTSPAYTVALQRRLRGGLAVEALRRAFEKIVQRHEALRTVFPALNGMPVQQIREPERWLLPVDDVSRQSDPEAAAAALVRAEAERPFDLATGPLLRTRLVRMAEDDHIVLLTPHHIVSDGWSMAVLWNEVAELYRANVTGVPSNLPPLSIQYADFAAWQRRWLSDGRLDTELTYWKRKLEDAPSETALPLKGPRPAVPSARGHNVRFELDEDLVTALRSLGRKTGATLFMTLLAAFRVVLARTCDQDDICIGTPIANRGHADVEPIIGLLLNTLVLRSRVDAHASFLDVVRRERATALEAYAHQDAPFEMIVDALHIPRALDRSPLFQVSFVHQNMPQALHPIGDLVDIPYTVDELNTRFDLSIVSFKTDRKISFELTYREDLFDAWQIEQLARNFQHFVREAVREPQRTLAQLPMIPQDERQDILVQWNRTPGATVDSTIPAVFEAQVDRTPDAPALVQGDQQICYRELDERANRIAHALRGQGVGPDAVVGIALERSFDLVASMLGTSKAGGAWVPLDPHLPAARLAYMAGVARPRVVITDRARAGTLPALDAVILLLDDGSLEHQPSTRPRVASLSDDNLAYVLFTSGSTGKPKGVMISHRGIVNELVSAQAIRAQLTATDTFLWLAPYTFDLSVHEILWPLSAGARVAILAEGEHRDPRRIAEVIRQHRVTIMHPVPTLLRALLADHLIDDCASLRTMCSGGEAMPLEVLRTFMERRPDVDLINSYGPTETSVTVSQWRCDADAQAVAIGKPWLDTQFYVVDSNLDPVPLGVYGELYIGGRQVARGYASQPALTAERFVPDPYTAGGRLYRTGDRVKRWPDGNIELVGRIDAQVKLRGFRIELGEIEAVMREHGSVSEAAVVIDGAGNDARLVAYAVAPASGWVPDALRQFLATRLPDYMVPRIFIRLDAMPLTRSGKIDRKALPPPDDTAQARTEYEAPRTPLEEVIAGVWCEILGVERISRHADFFQLGGHSLLAARLAWEIKVPVSTIFDHPTVAQLAVAIEAIQNDGDVEARPAVMRVARDRPLLLSYAQQRMWFLHQLEPTSPAYHMSFGRRLRGPIDPDVLRAAFELLVERHEILRTTFPAFEGAPRLEIHEPGRWELPLQDLSASSADEIDRVAAELSARPFDLATGPLLRTVLVRTGRDEHLLLVTMHHIIADGLSVDVFWRDLDELYSARVAGHAPRLPKLAIQYADYAAWQRTWLSGDVLGRQLSYWRERLAGAPEETELPFTRARPPVQTYQGAIVTTTLDGATVAGLHRLGQKHGTTPFITLLALLRALLYRYSGQQDICIGVPTANRSLGEVENLVGLFVNTMVLRTPISPRATFADLLNQERASALEAFAHAETPFEMIVDALNVTRTLSRNPLYQVMFQAVFGGDGASSTSPRGIETTDVQGGVISTHLDLEVAADLRPDRAEISFVYNVDLFDQTTIEAFARHFEALVIAVIEDADQSIGAVPLLSADERTRLVTSWNQSARSTPEQMLPDLIDARATATPDAIAIVGGNGELTYRELVARSNQIARYLRTLGVAPEERVAICLERGPDLVASMLGVLKAGGAYLPLDPDLPPERIAFMTSDAGSRIVLTQASLRDRVSAEVIIDVATQPYAGQSADPVHGAPFAQSLAYVLYTSGSTGRPKAVHVQHGSLVNFLVSMLDAPGCSASDILLAVTTASFDISGLELYVPLLAGGHVVIASRDDARDGARIRALLEAHDCTMMQATPATWRMVVDAGWTGRTGFVALCGGEALPPDLATALANRAVAWNMYGPTETTIWSARKQITIDAAVRLGDPIANTQLYVLDPASLDVAPFDVAGELFIGGDGLARGYGGQPGLTAERFLPDPFAKRVGQRMYRTGDRVRRRADGELEFLGRVDHQIKLHGFRIELGEIEAVLGEHPSVAEVVVVVRDHQGDPRLVAYVVALGSVSPDAILAGARERLPDYMVPSAVVFVDELPLSPAGKIDRRALPAPAWAATSDYLAPRNDVEVALVAIWERILGKSRVGIRDNFFELGGHSLLAIRVLWEINRTFDTTIPLREIFAAPTIEQFASLSALAPHRNAEPDAVALEPTDRTTCPVTVLQFANYAIHADDPANEFVHMPVALEFSGSFGRDALARALGQLVRRHSILRSTFRELDGELCQVVQPAEQIGPLAFEVFDLSGAPDVEAASRDFLAVLRAQPFDLTVAPLRIGVARLAADRHVLGVVLHHTCGDAQSLLVLREDLVQLYWSEVERGRAPLAPQTLQFIDYADYVTRHAASPRGVEELAYWQRRLEGAPAVVIPGAGDRAAVEARRDAAPRGMATFETVSAATDLDGDVRARLVELARQTDATLMIVLLAGYTAALNTLTGQTDICVQSTLSHRHHLELERVIGGVANPLLMRIDVSGRPSFRTLVARTQQTVLEAFQHGLAPIIDWAPHGLRRLNFNFIPHAPTSSAPEIVPGVRPYDFPPASLVKIPFDLHLWVYAGAQNVGLDLLANRELLAPDACQKLLDHYSALLIRLSRTPDASIE